MTIACRAASPSGGQVVQVFDLTAKKKLKQCEISEKIEYWTWVSSAVLAIVSASSVYHLDITKGGTSADKVFDRDPKLAGAHILGYKVNKAGNWCMLHGIATNEAKQVLGKMQLFMIEKGQGQFLEGYVGGFVDAPVSDAPGYTNNLFTFVEKKAADPVTRLHIMEIGAPAAGQAKFKRATELAYPPEVQGDFPVLLHPVT